MTDTALSTRPTAQRIALLALGAATSIYGLAIGVFQIASTIVEASSGTIQVTFHNRPAADGGDWGVITGTSGPSITYVKDTLTASISGLSGGPVALHAAGQILTALVFVALAACAYSVGRGLLYARPFNRGISRNVTFAAIAVLTLGLAGQLTTWAATVAVMDELQSPTYVPTYSRDFAFDPISVTIALALVLVAAAFRLGERIQRDTEGLV